MKEDDRAAEEEKEQEAANANAADIWAAWESGAIRMWRDSFTTDDGLTIRDDIVARTILAWFEANRRADHAEVVAAINAGQQQGPFTCSTGLIVRDDLFDAVFAADGGW